MHVSAIMSNNRGDISQVQVSSLCVLNRRSQNATKVSRLVPFQTFHVMFSFQTEQSNRENLLSSAPWASRLHTDEMKCFAIDEHNGERSRKLMTSEGHSRCHWQQAT